MCHTGTRQCVNPLVKASDMIRWGRDHQSRWRKHYGYWKWRQEFSAFLTSESFSWEKPKSPAPSSFTYSLADFEDCRVVRSCNPTFSALGLKQSYSKRCLTEKKKIFQYDTQVAERLLPSYAEVLYLSFGETASSEESSFSRIFCQSWTELGWQSSQLHYCSFSYLQKRHLLICTSPVWAGKTGKSLCVWARVQGCCWGLGNPTWSLYIVQMSRFPCWVRNQSVQLSQHCLVVRD